MDNSVNGLIDWTFLETRYKDCVIAYYFSSPPSFQSKWLLSQTINTFTQTKWKKIINGLNKNKYMINDNKRK